MVLKCLPFDCFTAKLPKSTAIGLIEKVLLYFTPVVFNIFDVQYVGATIKTEPAKTAKPIWGFIGTFRPNDLDDLGQ